MKTSPEGPLIVCFNSQVKAFGFDLTIELDNLRHSALFS